MASVGGDVACYDRDDFGVGAPGRIRQRRVAHTCTLHKIGCPYLDSSDGCIRESDPLPPISIAETKRLLPIHQQRIRSFCYWATVNSSPDRACVFTIADFRINFARVGTQTHMDLSELPPCRDWDWDWEPMATRTNRATVNRAKRLMGGPPDR